MPNYLFEFEGRQFSPDGELRVPGDMDLLRVKRFAD